MSKPLPDASYVLALLSRAIDRPTFARPRLSDSPFAAPPCPLTYLLYVGHCRLVCRTSGVGKTLLVVLRPDK